MTDIGATNQEDTETPVVPEELALLPIFNNIVYPLTMIPLAIGQESSIQLIDDALRDGRMIGLVTLKATDERPEPVTRDDFYDIGCAATVHRLLKMPDGTLRVAVQGVERIAIEEVTSTEPYFRARVRAEPDEVESGIEIEALMRNLQNLVGQMAQLLPQFPEELQTAVINEDDPRRLAYLLALYTRMDMPDRQALLEERSVRRKLEQLSEVMRRELQVLQIGQQIQGQVNEEVSRSQREYILRQQMQAIQRELGEDDANQVEIERFRELIEGADMPAEARETAERELNRLGRMNPASPDYGLTRTYLEILTSLPWNKHTDDQLDVTLAREVLDEDHYDLEEIKDRILEFLAVRELRRERFGDNTTEGPSTLASQAGRPSEGAILCFVGPPGVGKTSLGRSIARAMDRKFLRISLGGLRDEAEIRGHRRTYIGALPGTIIQSLRRVNVNNPVFMLDEIDKLGQDFRGDPASALLEVLDPEQNNNFRDHYLDVAFDLSDVMFIATANSLQPIPAPLRDRMEIIQLSGYTMQQKMEIAKRYLLPEQLRKHALVPEEVEVTDGALRVAIEEYTREAGVRNLEREIATICRKVATEIVGRRGRGSGVGGREPGNRGQGSGVRGQDQPTDTAVSDLAQGSAGISPEDRHDLPDPRLLTPDPSADPRPPTPDPRIVVDEELARRYLGRQSYFAEVAERTDRPGVVTGLVWTPVGGDIIFIEATKMPGGKGFMLTGQLGEVMRESARAALSYVRSEAAELGIAPNFFNGIDIHLHVPAGAIPKDGPSAGIAMATALASLLTGRPVRDDVAMTGEITLRGRVLPIGGLKEKVLAAHRAGVRTVIMPQRNEADLEEVPAELRAEMTFVPVERMEQVLAAALSAEPVEPPVAAADGRAAPMREGMGEGLHIIDESTDVPEEAPVDAPPVPARENV